MTLATMKFHPGVVTAIKEINDELKRRGGTGWGTMKELAGALTIFERCYQDGYSRKHIMVGYRRTGEVSGDPAVCEAIPSFDQFVGQLMLTGGRDVTTQQMYDARAAKDALLSSGLGKGELEDSQFEEFGYSFATGDLSCSALGALPRDQMQLSRTRAKVLNPHQALKGFREYDAEQAAMKVAEDAAQAQAAADADDAKRAAAAAVAATAAAHAAKEVAAAAKRREVEMVKTKRKAEAEALSQLTKRLKKEVQLLNAQLRTQEKNVMAHLKKALARRREMHDEAVQLTIEKGRGDFDAEQQCTGCQVHWDDWLEVFLSVNKKRTLKKFTIASEFLGRHTAMTNWQSDDGKHWCPCCYDLNPILTVESAQAPDDEKELELELESTAEKEPKANRGSDEGGHGTLVQLCSLRDGSAAASTTTAASLALKTKRRKTTERLEGGDTVFYSPSRATNGMHNTPLRSMVVEIQIDPEDATALVVTKHGHRLRSMDTVQVRQQCMQCALPLFSFILLLFLLDSSFLSLSHMHARTLSSPIPPPPPPPPHFFSRPCSFV